jgi:hypothetical protein
VCKLWQRVGIFVGFIRFASSSDSSEFRDLAGIGVKKAQAALHPGPEVRLPREGREHGVLRLAASEVYCVARPVKDEVVPVVKDHDSVVAAGRFVNEMFPFGSHLARPIVAPSESPMAAPARATGPVDAAGK